MNCQFLCRELDPITLSSETASSSHRTCSRAPGAIGATGSSNHKVAEQLPPALSPHFRDKFLALCPTLFVCPNTFKYIYFFMCLTLLLGGYSSSAVLIKKNATFSNDISPIGSFRWSHFWCNKSTPLVTWHGQE